jgi:outer membrane usher protein
MGGGVFLANRIDDAFAVVKAGASNVPVLFDNRQIGVTDARGMILVPGLRSYDKNQITFDPNNLPVDADIATTGTIVVPADRSGVLVDFGVRTDAHSALVAFTRADGSLVPVGSAGKSDAGEEFVVGYDGQAFLKNLATHNSVTIETPDGPCQAQFGYPPNANEQVAISPVECTESKGDPARSDLRGSLQQ